MRIFCSSAKLLQLLNKFAINIKDKHFEFKCSAMENISKKIDNLQFASKKAIEGCRLLKKMQHIEFHRSFD